MLFYESMSGKNITTKTINYHAHCPWKLIYSLKINGMRHKIPFINALKNKLFDENKND